MILYSGSVADVTADESKACMVSITGIDVVVVAAAAAVVGASMFFHGNAADLPYVLLG